MSFLIGVYGASGYGRETMPFLRMSPIATKASRIVFIDDRNSGGTVNGHEVFDWAGFISLSAQQKSVCLAIADSTVRRALYDKCVHAGVSQIEARAANVVEFDNVEIGEGAILSPFVTLTSNARIGRCFHANIYSYVAHDCIIGDFVTFGPAVKCNGNIVIEDNAYIGTGAILRQGKPGKPLTIGRGAIVGMGAVVTKDVPPGVTVVGNPARPLPARISNKD